MNKKPKGWGLTKKQKDYADALLETGNPVESAIQAYAPKDRNAARVIAFRNQRNFKIQDYVQASLMLSGTIDKSVQVLDDGLSATIIYKGEATDIPDHKVRLKASKQALDLVIPKGVQEAVEEEQANHSTAEFELTNSTPTPIITWIINNNGKAPSLAECKVILEDAITNGYDPEKNFEKKHAPKDYAEFKKFF